MATGSALHDELNERVRAALRQLMANRGWKQVQVGQELGFKQQTISSFLSRQAGAGLGLAFAIANKSGVLLDNILAGHPELRKPTRFGDLPGWREQEPLARQMFPSLPTLAFEAVANWYGDAPPQTVNAAVIGNLAMTWWAARHAPQPESSADDDRPVVDESRTRRRFTG